MGMPVSLIAGVLAKLDRLALEDDGTVQLGQAEECESDHESGEDGFQILCPAPSQTGVAGQAGPDDGSEGGPTDHHDSVKGDGDASRLGFVQVSQRGGHVGDGGTAKDTTTEARDEDARGIRAGRCADAEQSEHGNGGEHGPLAAIDF